MKQTLIILIIAAAINAAAQDTLRVNALIIDTAIVLYPRAAPCPGCFIGNGQPGPIAVSRDILQVRRISTTRNIGGVEIPAVGFTQYSYFELNGQPIDERRVFIYKQ